ncbi:MAG: DUF4194 domain-containing protein [Lentisphaeria bacterium]|nr:DUF4194 domain-containing protein [Lentisphaeria bacterium]
MSPSEQTINMPGQASRELSLVLVGLMKNVIYRDENPEQWAALLRQQAAVQDYVSVIGLELMLDEAEGYAFLRSRVDVDDGEDAAMPRLITRRQLSYPVSLLLALLRKKLAEFDAVGSETRLILAREDIVEMLRIFFARGSNEARVVDQVDSAINKIADLGFVRRLRGNGDMIEVRRIIKAFIDAQWLAELDQRLDDYRGSGDNEDGSGDNEDGSGDNEDGTAAPAAAEDRDA